MILNDNEFETLLKYEKILVVNIFSSFLRYSKAFCFFNNQEPHVYSLDSIKIFELIQIIKNSLALGLFQLLDLTAIDFAKKKFSYEVLYVFLNSFKNFRFILHGFVSIRNLNIPSISSLYPSSGWLEREVWDMFGIFFLGNNDLRRILTDYGFSGYPLRKSFPLIGYLQVRYDETSKKVILEPIRLTQDFRYFEFHLAWKDYFKE